MACLYLFVTPVYSLLFTFWPSIIWGWPFRIAFNSPSPFLDLLMTLAISSNINDNDLLQYLRGMEDKFFQAILDGPESTSDFASYLIHLEEMAAKRANELATTNDGAALIVAHSAASTISSVATGLCNVTEYADELTTELYTDVVALFDSLSIDTIHNSKNIENPPASNTFSLSISRDRHTSSRRLWSPSVLPTSHSDSIPPYNIFSYGWLRANLHNPYPPAGFRRRTSELYGVSAKTVSDGFAQLRRRIGWTSFLKRHFGGNRQLCIDCAYRILIEGSGPSTYADEIFHDLNNIKRKVERLYEDNVGCSDLAKDSVEIRHMTALDSECLTGRKRQRTPSDDDPTPNHTHLGVNSCVDASFLRPSKRKKCVCV